MKDSGGELAGLDDWDKSWASVDISTVEFDPHVPTYREMHRVLTRNIRPSRDSSFVELGAYPGFLMWYFHKYFQQDVSGIEYVPWCCQRARELLALAKVPAQIYQADLFDPASVPSRRWDIVASNGFIEHFSDTGPVIRRHVELAEIGGKVVIVVPNHSGIYGKIMKRIRPDRYVLHNRMTLADAQRAVADLDMTRTIFAGYIGRLGFWNSCLYENVLKRGRLAYVALRAPLWVIEQAAQYLVPNSQRFSPMFMLILERTR